MATETTSTTSTTTTTETTDAPQNLQELKKAADMAWARERALRFFKKGASVDDIKCSEGDGCHGCDESKRYLKELQGMKERGEKLPTDEELDKEEKRLSKIYEDAAKKAGVKIPMSVMDIFNKLVGGNGQKRSQEESESSDEEESSSSSEEEVAKKQKTGTGIVLKSTSLSINTSLKNEGCKHPFFHYGTKDGGNTFHNICKRCGWVFPDDAHYPSYSVSK